MNNEAKADQGAALKAVDGWMPEYFGRIFGVSLDGGVCHGDKCSVAFSTIETDQLVELLTARFDELDLAPKDGVVTYFELERAIVNPLLHWTEKDVQMIKLLKQYYTLLIELSDDEKDVMDRGISRNDVRTLAESLTEICSEIRRRMQVDFEKKSG